jgi:hypothetical protein
MLDRCESKSHWVTAKPKEPSMNMRYADFALPTMQPQSISWCHVLKTELAPKLTQALLTEADFVSG